MIQASDLSLADVEFLQAVRDINKNPEKYPETDRTDTPANTAAVKKATELSADQVSYRMGGNANSRGLEEPPEPLIEPIAAVPTDTGYSPRAAELTQYGHDVLSDAQKIGSRLNGVTQTDLRKLIYKTEFLELKSNIQDYMIMFGHTDVRYASSEDCIIGVVYNGICAKVSNHGEEYKIEVYNDDNDLLADYIMDYNPGKIAGQMIESVTQQN